MASVGHMAVGLAAARVYTGRVATARPSAREMLVWSVLAMLPDADVIGFPLGVRYADEWGHRGATHSLVFAAIVGIAAGLLARWTAMRPGTGIPPSLFDRIAVLGARSAPRDTGNQPTGEGGYQETEPLGWFRAPAFRTFVVATMVVASHSLLDTLTDGGLGCALFWPFDQTRYFAPWRPVPVAPIGLGYLSPYGLYVACTELAIFAPLVWFAFVPRTQVRGSASQRIGWRMLLVAVWLAGIWLLLSRPDRF